MEILKLLPAEKDYLWGGTKLRDKYGKKSPLTPLAETWECSVHPDGLSIVANGKYAGNSLAEVLKRHPEYLGTKIRKNEHFPILVKFIDAKKDLSVQVHPPDEYAWAHENDYGKSEMWYVVEAEKDARLVYGFEHPMTPGLLKEAIETGSLKKHLHQIPVQKGDVYFIPSGMVHGIGAGTLIAEIQENSNVTYRVYDYGRKDKNGKKRNLHFDQAVKVMDMSVAPDASKRPHLVHYFPGGSRELLCTCEYFEVEHFQIRHKHQFPVSESSFQVLLCLSGKGSLRTTEGAPLSFVKGDCLFLPAGKGGYELSGQTEFLKIRC